MRLHEKDIGSWKKTLSFTVNFRNSLRAWFIQQAPNQKHKRHEFCVDWKVSSLSRVQKSFIDNFETATSRLQKAIIIYRLFFLL